MFITFSLNNIIKNGTLPRMWCGMLLISTSFLWWATSKGDVIQAFARMHNEVLTCLLRHQIPAQQGALCFFLAQSRNREFFLRFSHLLLSKPWKFWLCSSGEIYFYEDCRKLELFPVFNELTYAVLQDYEKLKMLTQIELYGVALRIDLDWIKDGIKI